MTPDGLSTLPSADSGKTYASDLQFNILKDRKAKGTLGTAPLASDLWLTADQAKELGFNSGEADFHLTPTPPQLPNPDLTSPNPPQSQAPPPAVEQGAAQQNQTPAPEMTQEQKDYVVDRIAEFLEN